MVDRRSRDASAELSAILERARAGSSEAFTYLYEELAPAVAGYLRHSGVAEVDEVTNEVLAQVHTGLPSFSGDWLGLRSWVFTIAHHRMVDHHRRVKRRPIEVAEDLAPEPVDGDVESEALDLLSAQRVQDLLTDLSADQRQVVLLRIVADLPLEEVATAMSKSVGAVKALQHRALAALRRQLDQQEVQGE